MRILLGHITAENTANSSDAINSWLTRLRISGINVNGFNLSLPSAPRLTWHEIEHLWRIGDKTLLELYDRLARCIENYDVFVNFNGINLHPDFVNALPTFNVYSCFDDPEASAELSKPVAYSYDLCMVGNIAELDTYRSWGIKKVNHWPLGFRYEDYNPKLTKNEILTGERIYDITLICEKTLPWRKKRLDNYASHFPQGQYYGLGWPNGFLPEEKRVPLLQNTKIGLNLHNSTGPINFRTFYLPANGVMQICDNKTNLGKLFTLGKEAIGYDSVDEAIDLTKYYLEHDKERREIAAAGWERAMKDYNEVAIFNRLIKCIEQEQPKMAKDNKLLNLITSQRKSTTWRRIIYLLISLFNRVVKKIFRVLNINIIGALRWEK